MAGRRSGHASPGSRPSSCSCSSSRCRSIVAGREDVLVALPDVARDLAFGLSTLAVRLGTRRAFIVCWGGVAAAAALALILWPTNGRPGVLFVSSLVLLGLAVAVSGRPRAHRVIVPIAAVALAADRLGGLVA